VASVEDKAASEEVSKGAEDASHRKKKKNRKTITTIF
jgi:hypothetical protein